MADTAAIGGDPERESQPQNRPGWIGVAAIVAVTTGALTYVISQVSFDELITAFAGADYRWLLPYLTALTLFYWLKAIRWSQLLRPVAVYRVRQLWPAMMAGFAFNNLLLAHLGEFVRMNAFSRQSGVPRTTVLSTIALERLFDVIAILAFFSYGLLAVDGVDESLRYAGVVFLAASICGIVGAAAYVWKTDLVIRSATALLNTLRVPAAVTTKVMGLATSGAGGLAALRDPSLLLGIATTSLLQWALNGSLVWVSLEAFGLHVSAAVACLVLATVAFSVLLPSTPGYFGVIQGAFVLAMSGLPDFEQSQSTIVAASIFYHAAQWVPVTVVGLIGYRMTLGSRLRAPGHADQAGRRSSR